jgi:FemAB-related protein (PEP-CTERM system-associated)
VTVSADVEEGEWERYLDTREAGTGYHHWCWRTVFERAFGHDTIYLAGRRGRQVVGVLPLVSFRSRLFGRFMVSLPFVNYGGVVADDDAARRALVDFARQEAVRRQARHIELRHTARLFPDLQAKQHKVAMTLPLSSDADAAWRRFDNKVRNQVRKAQKSGLQTAAGGPELLDQFYAVFARNMRDLGTPVYSRRFFSEVLRGVPDARVHVVRLGARPIAAAITIGHRRAIENPWASSLREYRPLCANMLLYWAMIERAIADGYRVFDFGRSTQGESTWHFKKQWGAEESPFYWEYVVNGARVLPDLSPKNAKFDTALAVWKRLPVAVANMIGPHVVRNIP